MSVAILFGDTSNPNSLSGAIYLNATTSFKRSYVGNVTENPIDSGAQITDHYIYNSPRYAIQGVISCVDFSNIPSGLIVNGVGVMNSNSPPSIVNVSSTSGNYGNLIPAVVQQFMPNLSSRVVMDNDVRESYSSTIEPFLKEIMSGIYFNETSGKYENRMTVCTIFDVEGNTATNPRTNVVPVSISITEDKDSGDGVFLDMEFQEVRFVTLQSADAPIPVKKSRTAVKTEKKKDKGTPPKLDLDKATPEYTSVRKAANTALGN